MRAWFLFPPSETKMTTLALELTDLSADPVEEWQRMLRFSGLGAEDYAAMGRTLETLMQHSTEMVVETYDYLRSVPETAAILGWEHGVDEAHLEERRRFFTVWLARTLGMDTSEEFALYLFRAGKYHAGQGPRHIHTPPSYVTVSIGMVLAAFARRLHAAGLSAEVIASAMAGWSRYLSVQLNQMNLGYQVAMDYVSGDFPVHVSIYGRLRSTIGANELEVLAKKGATVADILRKLFNYFPQARGEVLERVWQSKEESDSAWMEVYPIYIPRQGWRVLLNGRDLAFEGGFQARLHEKDELAIFPPGR